MSYVAQQNIDIDEEELKRQQAAQQPMTGAGGGLVGEGAGGAPAGECVVCGVSFGEPCEACSARGFHRPGCPESDETIHGTPAFCGRTGPLLYDADPAKVTCTACKTAREYGEAVSRG